jgi:uncharacterized membrane protein YraQ (UPF0718 family)
VGLGLLLLWGLVVALAVFAATKPGRLNAAAGALALNQFVRIMPRLVVALIAAGFLGTLLPGKVVGSLIGPETGAGGILLASVAGGFTPGGPVVSFPLMVVLKEAGAGLPQLIAFLTGWSVFAFHRVMIYEATLMGWRFVGVRLFASLLLPPLAGFSAEALMGLFDIAGW